MAVFVVQWLLTALVLALVGRLVPGVEVRSGGAAIFGALVLGLVNALVRPVLLVLTLPLTVLTLGLFLFVLNGLMLMLAAALVPGFRVQGLGAAVLGSLVFSLLNLLLIRLLAPW